MRKNDDSNIKTFQAYVLEGEEEQYAKGDGEHRREDGEHFADKGAANGGVVEGIAEGVF